MHELATTGGKPRAIVPRRAKSTRISPRVKRAVHALITGEAKTIQAAAELAQLSAGHLYAQMKKPAVEAFYASESRKTISRAVMRAAGRLEQLIDAQSEHVSLDAAKHVLAIEGIKPAEEAQTQVNVNVLAGYMLDLNAGGQVLEQHTQSTDPVCNGDGDGEP